MTNVYRIGVSIAMANGVSPVLGVIAKEVLGLHGGVGRLTVGFSRLKLAIGGALAVATGAAILSGMGKMLNAAEDLTREQGKMAAAGLSNKEVAEATAKAWQMSANIMGARVSENLAAIAHLRAAIGDLHEAERVAPAYQRNAVALSSIMGRPGEAEAYKLAQAIHLSGAANNPNTKRLDPDAFARQMNLYTAMIASGGGKLSPQDLLQFQKQAGSYGGSLTNEGRINLTGYLQAMGGSKAGTQLSSLNRALKDGILQKGSLLAFESIGLIDPKKVVQLSGASAHGGGASPGGGTTFKPGALVNETQFREDLAGWVWGTLVPKLRAAGITSTSDQVNWIQHSKLTANPARILAELIRNQGVDMNEAANVRRASKADQYSAVMGRSWDDNKKAFHDAWKDFTTALAVPLVPMAIHTLQAITGAVKGMTNWSRLHPGAIKLIGGALAVLGTALIGFGVVAVGVAAFAAVAAGGAVGAVIAAIGALIGGMTALVALNWNSIKSAASGLWDFLKTAASVVGWVVSHPFQAAGAVLRGFLPKGMRDATSAEIAGGGAFNAKDLHPGSRVFDLTPQGWPSSQNPFTGAPANSNRPSAAPPPMKPAKMSFTGDVHMDGQKVGKVVWRHQADAMDHAALGGSSGYDPGMSLAPAGLSYA